MVAFFVSATLMLRSASGEVEASGVDATSGGGVPEMRVHITAYATTIPAATPSRALVSPGSVVGGALSETSQPHWAHSFASADIGSPQKLQSFFTLVPRAPLNSCRS